MISAIPAATGTRPVELDPKLVNSIGLHHSLATAIADLVDNSLDASAGTIRIRILLEGTAPVGVQVIDDGQGMDSIAVDRAMTYAGTRAYRQSDLGHFGVGLKAASLSQADTVLICSRAWGSAPVGRKLTRSPSGAQPTVGDLTNEDAAARLDDADIGVPLDTGTVVEWRDVRAFPSTSDDDERARWLEQAIREVRSHIGLVLHRVLSDGGPDVAVDTLGVADRTPGSARAVFPIHPFGYVRSGDPDFPQELVIRLPDRTEPVEATAHVWPPRSQDPGFKIGGEPGVDYQGFFVYRRDRLLQIGGWCGLWPARPGWELARIAVDLTDTAAAHVTINPEKSGIEFSADLRRALETAVCRASGTSIREYLDRAASEERRSRARVRRPVTLVEPRIGLPAAVLDAFHDAVMYNPDYPPVDVRWRLLPDAQVFRIDLEHRTLELNLRHRTALVGTRSLDPNDAPVLKSLMFLLMQTYFAGSHLGDRDKREIAAWQTILLAALRAQSVPEEKS
ncbi:ATP-binding protein [Actinopolymorpha sp. B9G3]|uniref:ATP-binding protein n=1 Tax=Actinopolymorpha sp. B9G3 TaxID=3158970 RepID=UPI0032D903E0